MIKLFYESISDVEYKVNQFIKNDKILVKDIKLSETISSNDHWNTTILVNYDDINSINLSNIDIQEKALNVLEEILKDRLKDEDSFLNSYIEDCVKLQLKYRELIEEQEKILKELKNGNN